MTKPPTTWQVMSDLDEAFNEIGALDFLLDQLQSQVDVQDHKGIVDATHALLAFLPPYIHNFDQKFKVAWGQTVEPELVNVEWENDQKPM